MLKQFIVLLVPLFESQYPSSFLLFGAEKLRQPLRCNQVSEG